MQVKSKHNLYFLLILELQQGAHSPISAKLFCKRSQIAFMPYGVVLKDERPTTRGRSVLQIILKSNKKTNTKWKTKVQGSSASTLLVRGDLEELTSGLRFFCFFIQNSMLDVRRSMFIF